MANSPSNIRFLLGYYRPYAARTLAAVLIGLPVSAISLAFPALTGRLVDSMLGADAPEQLTSQYFVRRLTLLSHLQCRVRVAVIVQPAL